MKLDGCIALVTGANRGLGREITEALLRAGAQKVYAVARNGGGAIANMLSVVSWYAYPFNATYCASKHAALALADGMRIQLRSKGTVVTGVYAGFIDTDMAAEVSAEKVAPSEVANRLLEGIEDGAAHVCADEYSKALFATLFANPASVEREMQIAWDSDNAWSN